MKYKMVFGTFGDGDNIINMREEQAASADDDNYINIDRGNGKPASAASAADTTNHVLPSTFFYVSHSDAW